MFRATYLPIYLPIFLCGVRLGNSPTPHKRYIFISTYLSVYLAFGLETRQHRINTYFNIQLAIFLCGVRLGNSPTPHKIYFNIYLSSLCGVRLGNSPTPHKHIYLLVYWAFGLETRQRPIGIYLPTYIRIRRPLPMIGSYSPRFCP